MERLLELHLSQQVGLELVPDRKRPLRARSRSRLKTLAGLALDAEFLVSEQTMQNHGVTLKQNRVLSTFGQKKSLQTRFVSLQVPEKGKKKWFQKAPKLKKQLGGSKIVTSRASEQQSQHHRLVRHKQPGVFRVTETETVSF